MQQLPIDKFVIAILVMVGIAYFFPQFGIASSSIPLAEITSIGISFIFFFYGLKLNGEKIKEGLSNWKLHLVVQATTFIIFPLIVLAVKPFITSQEGNMLWFAFFFLAALPSTVSSSVVMVSMAKGNVPAAIFNASISGLIGIVITPLWLQSFIPADQMVDMNMGSIYLKLILEIFIPICLGLFFQRFWGKYAQKHASQLALFDKTIILLIIYKSFAESFATNVFADMKIEDFILISVLVLLLLYSVMFITKYVGKFFNFSKEDLITTQFCGSKKSLVHGTVFSKILIPASIPLGVILVPLMLFHAWQILIISQIATQLSKRDM